MLAGQDTHPFHPNGEFAGCGLQPQRFHQQNTIANSVVSQMDRVRFFVTVSFDKADRVEWQIAPFRVVERQRILVHRSAGNVCLAVKADAYLCDSRWFCAARLVAF